MIRKNFLSFFSLFLLGFQLKAQEVDTKLWVNYALRVPLSEKLSYGGDTGYRALLSEGVWRQFVVRPTLTYGINNTFAAAGAVAWFSTFGENTTNLNEFRIHQDFNVRWPDFGFMRLFFRTRLEQRFFFYKTLPDDFDLRGRLLGGAQTKDLTFLGEARPVYFKAMFEGFVTLTRDKASEVLINSTRTHLAFGHRLSGAWRYEVHYIWQRSKLFSTGDFRLSQNVIRLRVFHTLFTKKAEIPEVVDPEIE